MLIATLLFSVMQVLVKLMGEFPFYQLIFARAITSFFISFFTLKKLKVSLWGNDKKNLILRGIFGALSLNCFFYALQNAPLASVITIVNIKPFLILVIGSIILKEKFSPIQLIFFGLCFTGIILIKGFDTRIATPTLFAILGAALFAAIAHTIVRKLKDSDHPVVIIFYFSLIVLPLISYQTIENWHQPVNALEWITLLLIGIITHFGQYFLTKAYQSDNVSKISIFYYLGIVFAFFFGLVIFDEQYNIQASIGLLVIILGIILNIWFTNRKVSIKSK